MAAPGVIEGLLTRPRLLAILQRRFEVPVIVITGGPGAGKTSLLSQALADNELAPRGVDVFWSCRSEGSQRSTFDSGLRAAAGLDSHMSDHDPGTFLAELAERWPLGVCLVMDDLHELATGSAGETYLRGLIDLAPATVHLVLASRRAVPGLVARRSSGDVAQIGEEDLRLTADEVAAAWPSLEPESAERLGGWPAMVALAARYGHSAATEFAWEAVVAGMALTDRRALRAVALVGGGDAAVVAAAAGPDAAPAAIADVPLVSWDGRHLVPHALWNDILADELGDDEQKAVLVRVGRVLLDRGEVVRAGKLFIEAEDWEDLDIAVRRLCAGGFAGAPRDVLAGWLTRLPPERHTTPEGLLLAGVTARATEAFGERARDLLERAIAAFRSRNDDVGEMTAASEYAFVCRGRGEMDRLTAVIARAVELDAAGHMAARGPATLARMVLADLAGDDATALGLLRDLPSGFAPEWVAPIQFMAIVAAFHLGDIEEMRAAADRCLALAPADYVGRPFIPLVIDWHTGNPAAVRGELPRPGQHPRSTAPDRLWGGAGMALIDAYRGRVDEARHALGVARAAATATTLPQLRALVALAAAATAVAAGDEEAAASELRSFLTEMPVTAPAADRPLRWAFAVGYVLDEAVRDHWRAAPLFGLHARNRRVAEAYLSVRRGQPPELGPDWPTAAQVSVALPLRWGAELAAALAADRSPAGRELAEVLVELHGTRARERWRELAATDDGAVARGARRLLGSIAVASGNPVEIRALGPAQLVVNGKVVDDPDWRRGRVRELLLYLIHRGRAQRAEVVEVMWPDLDEDAARRNLRVTLSHLQRLLEPERLAGEAPFYLRQDGEWLTLLGRPHVTTDAEQFETVLDSAEQHRLAGDVAAASLAYASSFSLWRGDYLADIADAPWSDLAATRLRSRYLTARLRAAELALRSGRFDEAASHATTAIDVDPWSERAYQILASALLRDGHRASARTVLDRCLAMLDDLGVEASADTVMLDRLVGNAIPHGSPT